MIKTEKKKLGSRGYTYAVRQFGAKQGGRVLVRLGKLLGKPIGDAVSAAESLDTETIGRLITGLAEALSETEYDFFVDAFAEHTEVSGGEYQDKSIPLGAEGVFDLHFAGAYVELVEWLRFAVEVNYSSFFSGLGSEAKDLAAALRVSKPAERGSSPSPSPNTYETTGRSGASQARPGSAIP